MEKEKWTQSQVAATCQCHEFVLSCLWSEIVLLQTERVKYGGSTLPKNPSLDQDKPDMKRNDNNIMLKHNIQFNINSIIIVVPIYLNGNSTDIQFVQMEKSARHFTFKENVLLKKVLDK
jgi:hypothetical protein